MQLPIFAIGIPTLNRYDLLMPAVKKYLTDFPNISIVIIDNGATLLQSYETRVSVLPQEKNLGVAASWNLLCQIIFKSGFTHALILNDDIELAAGEAQINELITKRPDRLYITLEDWCAFLMPKFLFKQAGPFDESFFPAYYEDRDYEHRMKLIGHKPIKEPTLSPAIYRNNSTSEKDPSIYKASLKNRDYYLQKWGGLPGQEKYLSPFDGKLKK